MEELDRERELRHHKSVPPSGILRPGTIFLSQGWGRGVTPGKDAEKRKRVECAAS